MSIDALFTPFSVRSLTLPNRVVMSPMSRYVSPGGVPQPAFAAYHRRRAEGGVGLVLTGATGIDRPASNNDPDLALFHGAALPQWQNVVDEVHGAGGRIGLQLWHAGSAWNRDADYRPGRIESPSGTNGPGKDLGDAMTDEDIADTIAAFARAAAEACRMGFDAIELHGAHGFLIDQFFWHVTNRRGDRWGGGSMGERSRFAVEVIRAVRAAVGEDYPIFFRISQWKAQDFAAKPADTPARLEEWLAPVVAAGIDVVHCSQRRFWEAEFDGSDLNLAGWVRSITGLPTVTVGSIGLDGDFFSRGAANPVALDELVRRLERGDYDLVAVGRALLGDPDWLVKVREGRMHELAPVGRDAQERLY